MLYGGLKAQFANVELANLLPSDVLDRVEANVALAFGVRAEVLGYMVGLKNSPWSHMETARRITYEDTIEPYWRREEKALSRQLLTDADRAARKFIRVDAGNIRALQDDEKMKADIARQNSDIWTVDERRIYTGKEPLGGPTGEEIRASTRPAPLTELAAEGPVERKQLERGHLEWLELDMTAKADERNWVPAVLRMLGKQRIDIERAFREFVRIEGTTVSPDSLARFLAEMSDYFAGPGLEVMRDALTPLVQSTTFSASRRLTARLGLDFNVVQEGLARFASNETAYLAKVLGQTTASRMAAIVQESMAERATFGDIVERIMRSTAFDENRAMMIARTETTRITNGARLESARQVEHNTGQIMLKSWLSSRDDRTRETHLEMDDGEWYPIEYEFPVGTKAPNEPNCRCQLGYMMQEEPDEVIAP
jgi:SPP1 gp7 family putative phage head morphogenesis protein